MYTYACMSAHMYVCVHACMQAGTYVCLYVFTIKACMYSCSPRGWEYHAHTRINTCVPAVFMLMKHVQRTLPAGGAAGAAFGAGGASFDSFASVQVLYRVAIWVL